MSKKFWGSPGRAFRDRVRLSGMSEMLIPTCLGLPYDLCKSLASTNIMESVNSVIARTSRNVTRWRNASMSLRWIVAGMPMAAGLPPRQRPHAPFQTCRRARQGLRGKNGPQVRAGGRRPGERRAGRRIADQLLQKAPQAPGRSPAPATPCALFAGIGRTTTSRQPESRNTGRGEGARERLTPQEVIGYVRIDAASPPGFNIDQDIPSPSMSINI